MICKNFKNITHPRKRVNLILLGAILLEAASYSPTTLKNDSTQAQRELDALELEAV